MSADDDGSEAFEKIMSANLQRAIDFLKYAEAKNGVLLTFSSAWILAIMSLLSNEKSLPFGIGAVLAIALPFFIVAALLAMLSFFPKMNWAVFLRRKHPPPQSKNLLFFGDIDSMAFSEFEVETKQRYFSSGRQPITNEYLHDLSVQIFANSRIVSRKLRLFQNGLLMVGIAGAILIIPIVYSVLSKFWGY